MSASKPKLTANQKLFREYLSLSRELGTSIKWYTIKNPLNKAEYLINTVRTFINNNPRLRRKHAKLLKKSTKETIQNFKQEVLKARELNRKKREGVQIQQEESQTT